MEETSHEDSKNQREKKTIGINQTIKLEKTLVNLVSQHVMNKYSDHGYIVFQFLVCGVNKSLMSKQDYLDLMTQHRPQGICSVDYTKSLNLEMSSELFSAMSTNFFGQQVITIAHVDVNMNLSKRQQMLNNLKKIQIIKTMALK